MSLSLARLERLARCAALIAAGLLAGLAPIARAQSIQDDRALENMTPATEPTKPWKLGAVRFPPLPKPGKLIELDSSAIGTRYQYYLDPASVSVGKDGVTRYTIVIVSPSGARNVLYEGIHCDASNARTFGYATRTSRGFQPATGSRWEPLEINGARAYRYYLADRFVCDQVGSALDIKAVRRRLMALARGLPIQAPSPK